MKIIVIGASGTIGRAVSEELSQRHEVIRVGRTRGDYQVDITSQESVEALFAQTGEVDAIVSTTGNLHFGPLSTMTDSQFNLGLQDKLLGQIRPGAGRPAFSARRRVDYPGQRYRRAGTHCSGGQCHDGQRRSGRLCPRRRLRAGRAGSASISSAPPCSASRWQPTATFSRASPAFPPPPWRRPIAAALKAFRPAASTRSATSLCRPAGAGAYIRPSLQVH
ncbi:short chain dehydrogenase [Klebsiella pneumoniae]|uniref:Short chain dehydrogenase n=1 Tax=Klebsiella pneumoniae TaxID=573 RepID=A0A3S5DHE2_KLEPN|nr:short chain dehydrogenase [Klebsiella pneumoniae]